MAETQDSTYPEPGDDIRRLLAKLALFLVSGSKGSMSEHFGTNLPQAGDGERRLLAKILIAINLGGGGGGGSGKIGTGSPEGVVTAAPGTTYYDSAAGTFWVKETGSGNTGWSELIA